jgi:hypothetical protein
VQVTKTAAAVDNLREERTVVNLHELDSGRFDPLSKRPDVSTLSQALNETAGIDDPGVAIGVALNWFLYSEAAKKLLKNQSIERTQQKNEGELAARKSLEKKQQYVKEANELQRDIQVGFKRA